jgi:hypothetical protein
MSHIRPPLGRWDRRTTLMLAGALLAAVLAISPAADGQRGGRQQRAAPAQIVVPARAETVRFRFDQNREPKSRTFTLQAQPPLARKPRIRKELAGDLESETGREFPGSQIEVRATRTEFGNVAVEVTLDPKDRTEVPAATPAPWPSRVRGLSPER